MHRKNHYGRKILYLLIILTLILPSGIFTGIQMDSVYAAENGQEEQVLYPITLRVVSARTEPKAGVQIGDPIDEYNFLINIDNTGDPFATVGCNPYLADGVTRNPDYPDNCELPSLRTVPAWAPIYTQGDQNDLSESFSLLLPEGKYLISVMADGFKLDGEHFQVPPDSEIVVAMHPFPLPPASMVIKVFEDNALTNGQFDDPSEHGLAGFRASIHDIAGEITTDIFGNPLCTIYKIDPSTGEALLDSEGDPIIEKHSTGCYSDEEGTIYIPNIGPMRYDVLVFPPVGQQWIQTTTLEGSLGWDTWLQEGGTGMDNEFLIASEPFPWTIFGYVKPTSPPGDWNGTGGIKGVIMGASTYIPAKDGLPYEGDTFGGFMGTKLHRPINRPWLSLNDLQRGDVAVWVGRGNSDGSFHIKNVPDGSYFLAYWDEELHYILDFVQVSVQDGKVSDVGIRMLTGWFTEISGTVFYDLNENGRRDPGEPGVDHFNVILKDRDNTEIDRMSIASLTDAQGYYELPKGYPMGSWMVLEAYHELFKSTGITYQTLNMKEEVTITGNIVNIGILPVLGQPVRLDWGVKRYSPGENGGIAGTVFYDTVRAEDNAQYALAEPWQPGIPGLQMKLYSAVLDDYGEKVRDTDGSYLKGKLLAVEETETYERPRGCQALDVNGNPVDFPVLPPAEFNKDCLEGPVMGTQIGDGQNPVDGNFGFEVGCFTGDGADPETGECLDGSEPTPLIQGHYLVEVVIPEDKFGKPMFQVTREEDLNVFDGDEFFPMIPPQECGGPLHIVDVEDAGDDYYPGYSYEENGVIITVPDSVPVSNPNFAAEYTSRYEGKTMPLCNVKHVYLQPGRSVAPIFNLFTEVPIPGRWRGYIIDNLNVSVNPNEMFFGEMAGVPEVPIGLYDYAGRLVHTVVSDRNGVYEVILPSTGTYNAPSPSGMFANVYYIYGNDPGPVGKPNPQYNPQYRSIGTSFEVYPGVTIPSDLAPTQNGAAVWSPGSQYNRLALCSLDDDQPQLFRVSQPYGSAGTQITVQGTGFGDTVGVLTLGDESIPTSSWSNTQIVFTVPSSIEAGPYQLLIKAENGMTTVNGLTFHLLGSGYDPPIYEVGPGRGKYDPANYDTTESIGPIQQAINDAYYAGHNALIVVYPGKPVEMINPQGMYLENPVIYAPVKLQGVGPGGTLPNGDGVFGTIIDGRAVGGDSLYAEWWREDFMIDVWNNRGGWDRGLTVDEETPRLYEGAVISVFGQEDEFKSEFKPAIDGFIIQGGDQQGFPNNRRFIGGEVIPGDWPVVLVQGGGIFVDGHADHLQITNNLIQGNGGSYGGAIRLGTPNVPEPLTDNHNDNIRIAHNRIIANGGTNLAGAVAVFAGADNYEIAHNDICGNSSIEYGGGISHYGYSPNGAIHNNRIYFNSSYDEGGGVMIAGQLPAIPGTLSPGAGPVDIYNNLIQSNLANDDGGGLRFLMAGEFPYNIYNNIITNNISTHEGGGISLNDTPDARIFNNTIMKNITTATAMTSNGMPAPAGLSSSRNSVMLQGTLSLDYPLFSQPLLFNNIFWDNRAGTWTRDGVKGIGLDGDTAAVHNWDLGVAGMSGMLEPKHSLLHVPYGNDSTNIVGHDPMVNQPYDTVVRIFPWRGNANFVGANIVAVDMPVNQISDYHISSYWSPAKNKGTAFMDWLQYDEEEDDYIPVTISTPAFDIDGDPRPGLNGFDLGADEFDVDFPVTWILDNFNRANGALGANWAGDTQQQYFRILDNQVQVRREGAVWWTAGFGSYQEVYLTFTKVVPTATEQALLLKMENPGPNGANASWVKVNYNAPAGRVEIFTKASRANPILQTVFEGVTFNNGDTFGARVEAEGWVIVYKNHAPVGSFNVSRSATPWFGQGGYIGVNFRGPSFSDPNDARFDNFGGGTMHADMLGMMQTDQDDGDSTWSSLGFEVFIPVVQNK
jgi:hypothetical protein